MFIKLKNKVQEALHLKQVPTALKIHNNHGVLTLIIMNVWILVLTSPD